MIVTLPHFRQCACRNAAIRFAPITGLRDVGASIRGAIGYNIIQFIKLATQEIEMLSRALSLATVIILTGFATVPAQAQNLEAGKSPVIEIVAFVTRVLADC
jgi:hypothetical protein